MNKLGFLSALALGALFAAPLAAARPVDYAWKQALARLHGQLDSAQEIARQQPAGVDANGLGNALDIHLQSIDERYADLALAFGATLIDQPMTAEDRAAFLVSSAADLQALNDDLLTLYTNIEANYGSTLGGDFLVNESVEMLFTLESLLTTHSQLSAALGLATIRYPCRIDDIIILKDGSHIVRVPGGGIVRVPGGSAT